MSDHDPTRTAFITGTSTGIGRATALRLDASGWRVFAGVRREQDGESLRAESSPRLTPCLIDVTDAASIDLAAKHVKDALGEGGLVGLVNNAGIGVGGPLEYIPIDELRRQFEVNVLGPAAVTRAFLPLLRRPGGRIVNVSSVAGRMTTPLIGPYCASKYALEALSDALRIELRGSGIEVAIVEPGFITTPMLDKAHRDIATGIGVLPEEARERYEEPMRRQDERFEQFGSRGAPPEAVARKIERALTRPRPRTRYSVGVDAKLSLFLNRVLPDRAIDAILGRLVGL
jgi:NAD(P)-dependent dehydrogenase (short-subunit alcohol dehydrogenase family)